jgi:hypothetical protein
MLSPTFALTSQALAWAAASGTSRLSVVTRTASTFNPLFMSKRCLRSKLFTNSRVALPIAPAMLLASPFIVRPSEPTFRSSYLNVTLYAFKMISLNGRYLRVGLVKFSLAHFLNGFSGHPPPLRPRRARIETSSSGPGTFASFRVGDKVGGEVAFS